MRPQPAHMENVQGHATKPMCQWLTSPSASMTEELVMYLWSTVKNISFKFLTLFTLMVLQLYMFHNARDTQCTEPTKSNPPK